MTVTAEQLDPVRELFPNAGAELLRLLTGAREHAGLADTDLLTVCDLLALSGYDGSEPLAALLTILLVALEEGSLCVEFSDAGLRRRLADLAEPDQAKAWAEQILNDVSAGTYPELIAGTAEENKPVVICHVNGARYVYFQKYLHHDLLFQEQLQRRLGSPAPMAPDKDLADIVEKVLADAPHTAGGKPLLLDSQQRRAVEVALRRSFAVVSGGPGTGKTSIVLTLLRCLTRTGVSADRIALAAPTGRAAQRMTDALRRGLRRLPSGAQDEHDAALATLSANTLHHLLRYHPERGTFGHHAENPVPYDVVIVDETSMVPVVLMAQLLQGLRPQTKLVLLGDKDQLPSVEAGAVLAELVARPGAADFIVALEENYRSEPRIREAAQAINVQDMTLLERLPVFTPVDRESGEMLPARPPNDDSARGCWFLPLNDGSPRPLRRVLTDWADAQYLAAGKSAGYQELLARVRVWHRSTEAEPNADLDALFELLGQARLLTLLREGPWGCEEINRVLEEYLRPKWDRAGRGGLFAGAPVLITRNDHLRQLYNGDVGIALRAHGGGLRVVFARGDGYVGYPADALPAHELGFALTVHKSQGSEYDRVLLIMPPTGGRRLLTKEILYTGVTRAKQLAVICGTREAVQFAIARRIVRESPPRF